MGISKTKHVDIKSPHNPQWTAQQTARRNQMAEYLFQKYSIDKAREKTQAKLGLKTYARSTAYEDYNALLEEWQTRRVGNIEGMVAAEVAEIEYMQNRLWQRVNERNGRKTKTRTSGKAGSQGGSITPTKGTREDADDDAEIRYIHEIGDLAKEKRKLLGLYSPEKRDISGSISFAQTMMAAAITEHQQAQEAGKGTDLAADGKPIDWNEI